MCDLINYLRFTAIFCFLKKLRFKKVLNFKNAKYWAIASYKWSEIGSKSDKKRMIYRYGSKMIV